ncbi:nucleotidyltransferase family protein [Herbaspirillum rubrisubalbicans]|uniref:Mannose-1-phosphate guanylyltransferase n=1 Tax=Herbaspirillum rubrisubalbicans Os34 TaxID=1235827 RepID=A0A6M3ZYI3_9BURK|nr:nucleotidyltransferase family protein [Herbaspirillum rubrisubalbicans]QJQ03381.1 mannose-1-phosphate guanylyltransferase [Herbaspirillum rubrisubalbicans Os34]
MRALLLAAGLGTRLRPLTDFLPKCLVPIAGRPLLDYWIETLLRQGVEDILINTHYRADLVERYIAASTWCDRVTLVHEPQLLGTAGTALTHRQFFGEQPFLLAHADNLTRFDCRDFLSTHRNRPHGTALTMMLFETPDPQSCGIVELDTSGVVQAFHEKQPNPPGNLANAAVYVVEPEVLTWLASLGRHEIDFSTEVIPRYLGHIATFANTSYHRDIGTVQSWAQAQQDFAMPPAQPQNQQAWTQLLASLGPDLPSLMAQLSAS